MPKRSLRSQLLARLLWDLRAATELGLAFAMTAGVASCGGKTAVATDGGTGTKPDAGAHEGPDATVEGVVVEAASFEGGVVEGVEAASVEGGVFEGSEGARPDGAVFEAVAVEGGVFESVSADGGVQGH